MAAIKQQIYATELINDAGPESIIIIFQEHSIVFIIPEYQINGKIRFITLMAVDNPVNYLWCLPITRMLTERPWTQLIVGMSIDQRIRRVDALRGPRRHPKRPLRVKEVGDATRILGAAGLIRGGIFQRRDAAAACHGASAHQAF